MLELFSSVDFKVWSRGPWELCQDSWGQDSFHSNTNICHYLPFSLSFSYEFMVLFRRNIVYDFITDWNQKQICEYSQTIKLDNKDRFKKSKTVSLFSIISIFCKRAHFFIKMFLCQHAMFYLFIYLFFAVFIFILISKHLKIFSVLISSILNINGYVLWGPQ